MLLEKIYPINISNNKSIKSIINNLFVILILFVSAQIKIFIPFSPIPITMQTFAIIYMSLAYKSINYYGVIAYIILGSLGLPVFANAGAGFSHLFGPSGGYLIGFILFSYYLNKVKFILKKNIKFLVIILISNFVLIYIPGLLQLSLFLRTNFINTLYLGLFPFIIGDTVKIIIAFLLIQNREA